MERVRITGSGNIHSGEYFEAQVRTYREMYERLLELFSDSGSEVSRSRIIETDPDIPPHEFIRHGYHKFVFPQRAEIEMVDDEGIEIGKLEGTDPYTLFVESKNAQLGEAAFEGGIELRYADDGDFPHLEIRFFGNIETSLEKKIESIIRLGPPQNIEEVIADLDDLFVAFRDEPLTDFSNLFELAALTWDFRSGRQRSETDWESGLPLSDDQRKNALLVAYKWNMLHLTRPIDEFDSVVVLGAKLESLDDRIRHALHIMHANKRGTDEVVLLCCERSLDPNERLNDEMDTESDLAKYLIEKHLNAEFQTESVICWDDLQDERSVESGNYGLASIGRIGDQRVVVLSCAVPNGKEIATTSSTLKSLKSFFGEGNPRLLFVTSAPYIAYQAVQVGDIFFEGDHQIVGYSPAPTKRPKLGDDHFRKILQELGSTVRSVAR